MKRFVATFHTHLSALLTDRALKGQGIPSRMMPVFRKLSSSCGTCVVYEAEEPRLSLLDEDVEGVYEIVGEEKFIPLFRNE